MRSLVSALILGRGSAPLLHRSAWPAKSAANPRANLRAPRRRRWRREAADHHGIDERDSYDELLDFVDTVAAAGCQRFAVHARKAWLEGLDPKQNRTVPPLRYDLVHALKRDRPALIVELNGGLESLSACQLRQAYSAAGRVDDAAGDARRQRAESNERNAP